MPDHSPQDRNRPAFTDPMWNEAVVDPVPPGFVPAPENYGVPNFAYRGGETHGVVPLAPMHPMDDPYAEGGAVPVDIEPPVDTPAPVPVRIVDTSPDDYKDWRAWQRFALANIAKPLADRKEGRTALRIKNLHATDAMYVGPDATVTTYTGFRVEPAGTFTLECESPVWGISATANDIPVSCMMEFSSPIR